MLFGNADITSAPMVVAIKIASAVGTVGSKVKIKGVGVAFADTSTRKLGVADFVDNDSFLNTEVCFCFPNQLPPPYGHSE